MSAQRRPSSRRRGSRGPDPRQAALAVDRPGLAEWRPTTTARLLAWCAGALGVALLAAAVFGLAVFAAYGIGRDQDGWQDLASVVLGIFAAMAAAAVLWLAAIWVAILRYVSPGRRKPVVWGVLGTGVLAFAVLVVGGSVNAAGRSGGWLVGLAALVLLVLPPLILVLRVRHEPKA